jgi:hypothetical protein
MLNFQKIKSFSKEKSFIFGIIRNVAFFNIKSLKKIKLFEWTCVEAAHVALWNLSNISSTRKKHFVPKFY